MTRSEQVRKILSSKMVSIPEGWASPALTCIHDLLDLFEEEPNEIVQIKQKLGRFVVYTDKYTEKSSEVISTYANLCSTLCEVCGAKGELCTVRGYIAVKCPMHRRR